MQPVTTWTPTQAWVGPEGEVVTGEAALSMAGDHPDGLVQGWADRLFSLRTVGGRAEDGTAVRRADLRAALLEAPLRDSLVSLADDPAHVSRATLLLLVLPGWNNPQAATAERVLAEVVERLCPEAEVIISPVAPAEALEARLAETGAAPAMVLDLGEQGSTAHLFTPGEAPSSTRIGVLSREGTGSALLAAQELGEQTGAERVLLVGAAALAPGVLDQARDHLGGPEGRTQVDVDPYREHAAVLGALALPGEDGAWWPASTGAAPAGAATAAAAAPAAAGGGRPGPIAVAAAAGVLLLGGLGILVMQLTGGEDEPSTVATTASPTTGPATTAAPPPTTTTTSATSPSDTGPTTAVPSETDEDDETDGGDLADPAPTAPGQQEPAPVPPAPGPTVPAPGPTGPAPTVPSPTAPPVVPSPSPVPPRPIPSPTPTPGPVPPPEPPPSPTPPPEPTEPAPTDPGRPTTPPGQPTNPPGRPTDPPGRP